MRLLKPILEHPFIARIRRNHALEHATIHILSRRIPRLQVVGRTTPNGFYLYGDVPTQAVADAATEALARLQAGERDLAVHPRCGTNLATAGVLAGLSAFAALGGRSRSRWSKLPRLLMATTLAVIAAQPLGLMLQEHVTTSSDMAGVTIKEVTRQQRGNVIIHRVDVG